MRPHLVLETLRPSRSISRYRSSGHSKSPALTCNGTGVLTGHPEDTEEDTENTEASCLLRVLRVCR